MKKIILGLVLIIGVSGISQTTVSGVVTYFYNEYQGNKADIGANVTLIDSAKVKNFDYKLYEKYSTSKHYNKLVSNYSYIYNNYSVIYNKYDLDLKSNGDKKRYFKQNELYRKAMDDAKKSMDDAKKYMDEYSERLKENNSETLEKTVKIQTDLYFNLLKLNDDLPKKTVDASGNYSINIKPGVYYVLIKSKNRIKKYNVLEDDGQIYLKRIKIEENESKDVSVNFEI